MGINSNSIEARPGARRLDLDSNHENRHTLGGETLTNVEGISSDCPRDISSFHQMPPEAPHGAVTTDLTCNCTEVTTLLIATKERDYHRGKHGVVFLYLSFHLLKFSLCVIYNIAIPINSWLVSNRSNNNLLYYACPVKIRKI